MKTATRSRYVKAAIARAVRKALVRHKLLGVPIHVWRNGRVVRIPPEKIAVRVPGSKRK